MYFTKYFINMGLILHKIIKWRTIYTSVEEIALQVLTINPLPLLLLLLVERQEYRQVS